MTRFVTTPLACLVCLAVSGASAAEDEGWTNLLEGNTIEKHWTTKGNWSIDADGVVTLEPRPGESGWSRWDSYLWSNKSYEDFEIEFDYRVQPKGNSGFYFNVGDKGDPVQKGIEVQIYDSHAKGTKGRFTDHDSGGIIPGLPPTRNTAKPAGEWNHLHVVRKGSAVTVKLNGEVVNEVQLDNPKLKNRPTKGHIGFQDHALPLSLRRIRIRES